MGASGAGKSTLLHLLGALDRPTGGTVRLDGRRYDELDRRRAGGAAQPEDRIRLPVPPSAARVHRAGERDDAAADRRGGRARRPRARAEELLAAVGLARPDDAPAGRSSRAASSSARRWRARWRPIRASCWPTSRRATSTTPTASGCTSCSPGWRASSRRRWSSSRTTGQLAGAGRPHAVAGGRAAGAAGRRGGDALMSCDQCEEREAVMHLTQIVNDTGDAPCISASSARRRRASRARAARAKTPLGGLPRGHGEGAPTRRRRADAATLPALRRRRCRISARPDGWAAPSATGRSRSRCASCCDGCTARRQHVGERYAEPRTPPAARTREQAARAARAAAPGGRERALRAGGRAARPDPGARMIDLTLLPDGGLGWLDASGPASHLVLSTRIRLARNLAGHAFSGRNDRDRARGDPGAVEGAAAASRCAPPGRPVPGRPAGPADRQLLHERHLVSKELAGLDADGRVARRGRGAGPGPARRDGERGGPPPAAGAAFRASRWRRRTPRWTGWTPNWGTTCLRISPGVRLPYHLSDQRRDRAAGLGADPPAGARADEGDRQGAAGADAGGADLPRAVRRGQRGRRQLLPDLEPDDAGEVGGGAARSPGQDRAAGDRVRGAGAAGAAARRAGDHRGQGVAGVRAAALRAQSCRSTRR